VVAMTPWWSCRIKLLQYKRATQQKQN